MTENRYSLCYIVLTLIFVLCLIVANLIEIKTLDSGGYISLTAGVIIFPISYIVNDCIVEVYGLRKAKTAIWLGFGSALFVTLMLQLAIALPGGPYWDGQEAMVKVYGAVPRVMAASFAAFLCGSMVNAFVMARMKRTDGNRRFGFRAILSSLFGEGVDSSIFFPVAFAGVLPWSLIISLIVTQTIIKTLYEVIILPVTIAIVKTIRRHDSILKE